MNFALFFRDVVVKYMKAFFRLACMKPKRPAGGLQASRRNCFETTSVIEEEQKCLITI